MSKPNTPEDLIEAREAMRRSPQALTDAELDHVFRLAEMGARARIIEAERDALKFKCECHEGALRLISGKLFDKEEECDALKEDLHATNLRANANASMLKSAEEERDALKAVASHVSETLRRQINLINERAPGKFLDKQPVLNTLALHKRRLDAALREVNRD